VQRKHSSPRGGTLVISENFFTPEPSSSVLAHTWALSVFRVEDHSAQQRVLRALRLLGRADLTALGMQRCGEAFVVIDWDSMSDEVHARHVVMAADAHAEIAFDSRRGQAVLP
jgi:hypothetical protein